MPPLDLRPSDRPVRSDHALQKSYARRRMITLGVLGLIVVGGVQQYWTHRKIDPADIPTIKAEASYKERPVDPGGIDIPHQDMQVYDEMAGAGASVDGVEHLLPPPEVPKQTLSAAAAPTLGAPSPAPQETMPPPAAGEPAKPVVSSTIDPLLEAARTPAIATTATQPPAPVAAPIAAVTPAAKIPSPAAINIKQAAPKELTIEQVIKETRASSPTASAAPFVNPAASVPPHALSDNGNMVIQLASSPEHDKAQAMLADMEDKYAAQLGGASLHLARADLGERGVFYRIQSQGMNETAAAHICNSLKQAHAGCILVRR